MVKMKLHSLKIKDELQSRLAMNTQYLAYSVLKDDHIFIFPGTFDPHRKELSLTLPEDDDIFKDALPDFMSLPDPGIYSQNMDITQCLRIGDINDRAGNESAEALIHDTDLRKGKGISGEVFYEAQGSDSSDFVSVTFLTRSPSSPDYDGIDTKVLNVCVSVRERETTHRPHYIVLLIYYFFIFC